MRFAFLPLSVLALALLGGCSDPPPPTARGGWTVGFTDTGIDCKIASHTTKIGDVTDQLKVLVTDGTGEMDVSCNVVGSGSFNVDASVSNGIDSLSIIVNGIAPGATKDKPVAGAATFASVKTAGQPFSSGTTPCNFYFTPGAGQTVSSGQIWLTFDCPEVILGGEGQSCRISQGFLAVDRCGQ